MTKTKFYKRISVLFILSRLLLSLIFGIFLVEVVGAACPSGMVSYWTFDNADLSGDDPLDVFGGNDGTTYGATIGQIGQVKEAFNFDGVDDYVETAANNQLDSNTSGTVTAWFKCGAGCGAGDAIVSYTTTSVDTSNFVWRIRNNVLEQAWNPSSTPSGWNWISGTTLVNDNEWHFVAFSADGTGRTKIYLDGVEETTSFSTSSGSTSEEDWTADMRFISTQDHHIDIGSLRRLNPTNWFNGLIDEVAIYDRALSEPEIQNYYQSGLNNLGYCEPPYKDIGLRAFDGTQIVSIAVEPLGTLTSPLRIAKNGDIYGIVLVDLSDPDASGIRIWTSSGIKALKKYVPLPTAYLSISMWDNRVFGTWYDVYARVTVTENIPSGPPMVGVTVQGAWSGDLNGPVSDTGTTDGNGQVTLRAEFIGVNGRVTYTVNSITMGSDVYELDGTLSRSHSPG